VRKRNPEIDIEVELDLEPKQPAALRVKSVKTTGAKSTAKAKSTGTTARAKTAKSTKSAK
jgi:hypothetical protein